MSTTEKRSSDAIGRDSAERGGMNLEVLVIPVSDVDRAKAFYGSLGWRLDADRGGGEFRLIQFTPPGFVQSPPPAALLGRSPLDETPDLCLQPLTADNLVHAVAVHKRGLLHELNCVFTQESLGQPSRIVPRPRRLVLRTLTERAAKRVSRVGRGTEGTVDLVFKL